MQKNRLPNIRTSEQTEVGNAKLRNIRTSEGTEMTRIIGVVNQKGGVGKTTTTVNLSAVMAETSSVLAVDIDPQASASWWADRVGEDLPYDFVADTDPAHLSRLRELPYDLVFVDTPGSLEAAEVLATVISQCDFVIVPIDPAPLSFAPTRKTIEQVVKPAGVPYRIVINGADSRVPGELEEAQNLLDAAGYPRFTTPIRSYKRHREAPLRGDVVTSYELTRATMKSIEDYRRLGAELLAVFAHETRKELI